MERTIYHTPDNHTITIIIIASYYKAIPNLIGFQGATKWTISTVIIIYNAPTNVMPPRRGRANMRELTVPQVKLPHGGGGFCLQIPNPPVNIGRGLSLKQLHTSKQVMRSLTQARLYARPGLIPQSVWGQHFKSQIRVNFPVPPVGGQHIERHYHLIMIIQYR